MFQPTIYYIIYNINETIDITKTITFLDKHKINYRLFKTPENRDAREIAFKEWYPKIINDVELLFWLAPWEEISWDFSFITLEDLEMDCFQFHSWPMEMNSWRNRILRIRDPLDENEILPWVWDDVRYPVNKSSYNDRELKVKKMDEKIFNIRLCPECEEMDRKHKEQVRVQMQEEPRLAQVNYDEFNALVKKYDEAISNGDGENSS